MLDARLIQRTIEQNFLGKGMEHTVGVLRDCGRVIKDYDTRFFDEETFEVFYKPAELPFDYLTDHLLANHLFGDDIWLEGFYEEEGSLHIVISQPFIQGRHPGWQELVDLMDAQGLAHESPGSTKARFWLDGGSAGRILVTDVHEDNVLIGQLKQAHPIDVHFSFAGRAARITVLDAFRVL